MDLLNQLEIKTRELETSIKSVRNTGTNYASAERDYKILLRQEVLKLQEQGMKVTLIPLVIYGVPSVASARYKRDVAESVYKANLEAIASIKLQMRIISSQIDREYGISGKGDI